MINFYPRHEYNYLRTLTLTHVPTWHEKIITQTRTQAARELLVRRAILLVDCWNCLAMVNVIISLFPLFVFLKQRIAWLRLNPAICYLASLKAYTSKISSWKIFFKPKKWLKAYETGYPVFINNFLKPERVVCSKCQYCSSIKTTSLKLVKSGQFFFHANYRIPVCETTAKYFWYNWLPVHVNMSWALGLKWFWMKQFFTKAVLSLFCDNILLQISDMADYNHIPLLNTINVYKTSFQD